MLRTLAIVFLCGFVAVSASALQPDVQAQLQQAIWERDAEALAALHESLAVAKDETDAQALYDWAYAGWRYTQVLDEKNKDARRTKKRKLKELHGRIERFLKAESEPDHPELLALFGSVLGDRISGPIAAMRLGSRAGKSLDQAYELAPENPRVALQRGVGYFFTPKSFGGGIEKAEAELTRAVELFAEQPADAPWPNWGSAESFARLGQVKAKQGDAAAARDYYEQALAVAPNFSWVSEELLPELETVAATDP